MAPVLDAPQKADGIQSMVAREQMDPAARKMRDTYAMTPGAPLYQREFGYFCQDAWKEQGLAPDVDYATEFGYDAPGTHGIGRLGWVEAAFEPGFEEKVVEDRGEYEVIRDFAGRHKLVFKGRRTGFMPEYLEHPVKDMKTWEEDVKWRLAPDAHGRFSYLDAEMSAAGDAAGRGLMLCQRTIGGYMYLRSLIGPGDLLYMFYDNPELIHDCMQTWLALTDTVIARHQQYVTFDELFLAEDICYNHGPLISPDMMREFLWPYYQQLITNMKARQIDRDRHLHIQIDTDGNCLPVIDIYKEIGADAMSPFEVASGCDVVAAGLEHPDLVISGGIDKRILAKGKKEIDAMVDRIFPAMQKRGGYIPTCDHGVPAEVSLENYRHYRKRCLEFA